MNLVQHSELLTATEVAQIFGVTPQAVSAWMRNGHLPYVQLPGGGRRVRRVDVDEILTPRINVDGESQVFRTAVS